MQERLKTCSNLILANFRIPYCGYDIGTVIVYIIVTGTLVFKQFYVFYKFYLIKQTFLSERSPNIYLLKSSIVTNSEVCCGVFQ